MTAKTKAKDAPEKETSTSPRFSYYRSRNDRIVSFVVDDVRLKQRIIEAAQLDGRSVNSWLLRHILPKIELELHEQLSKGVRR